MTFTHEEFKERNEYIKDKLSPLKDEIKKIRSQEKDDNVYYMRSMNAKMDSVVQQMYGLAKDMTYARETLRQHHDIIGDPKGLLAQHDKSIAAMQSSIMIFKWLFGSILIPLCAIAIKMYTG